MLHGITADSLSSRLTYRWDESRSLSASFAYLPFTDGNQRYSGGVTYTQKLVNLPGFDLTGTGEVYASHNDRPQAPYFNPDRDLTVAGGLLAEQTIWRRYDDSLVQALLVNAGLYDQAGFGFEADRHAVSYEHRWHTFRPIVRVHLWGRAEPQGLRRLGREHGNAGVPTGAAVLTSCASCSASS